MLPYALRGDASDFPTVQSWTGNKGVQEFKRAVADRELAEDRRLAYVALTRAARRLVVTGHRWGPSQQRPRGASVYLQALHDECVAGLGSVLHWHAEPETGETNPALEPVEGHPWPVTGDADARARREAAATMVRLAMEAESSPNEVRPESVEGDVSTPSLTDGESELVAQWDHDAAALLAEARQRHETPGRLPPLVSATTAVHLLRDPAMARRRMVRPLPARPAEAANRGTRFHQWVEARFGQVPLLDLEAPGDADDAEGAELAALQAAFLAGPYADRQPAAVEAPFQLVLGQGTVAGRIDAVYRVEGNDQSGLPEGTVFEVVDWKTGRRPADVFQLAIYRLAWAELNDLPVEKVAASFYYVATGERERPSDLPDRALLTEWWARATA